MSATETSIQVWDLPVRIGHWSLAIAFVVAWLTGESEEWRLVHVASGGIMVGIVVFRVFWGLFGSRYALFADFIRSPSAAYGYVRSLLGPKPVHYIGHNPAGGWAILALLVLTLVTGAAGWLVYQDIGGEWLEELHELAANGMLAMVIIHLGGVLIGSVAHGENLPRTMVTGRKLGHANDAIGSVRPMAALMLIVWATLVAWWLAQ